ncbi:MAG TPA: hypothetical protein VEI97_11450, partial [bacterium]|nr:hypothetical protein [bacterium]
MRISSQSPHYPSAASRRPPWPVVVVVLLAVLALAGISWPALSGPAADFRLNRAIHRAAGSFTPEALERITSLGLHAVRVRSFAGLESCPNLQRLYIHPDSVEPWRTWA